jgi:hypothetical protein
MCDSQPASPTVEAMITRSRVLVAVALIVAGLSFLALPRGGAELTLTAEGEAATGMILKVPPMTLTSSASSTPPVLYSSQGEMLPWASTPERTSAGWDLTPQILASGSYRVVAGSSSAVFAVRAASATPPMIQPPFMLLPFGGFFFSTAVLVLLAYGRVRNRYRIGVAAQSSKHSHLASAVIIALATGLLTPTTGLAAASTSQAELSAPGPSGAAKESARVTEPDNADASPTGSESESEPIEGSTGKGLNPPVDRVDQPLSLEDNGTIVLGPLTTVKNVDECLDDAPNTHPGLALAAGCISIALQGLAQLDGIEPIKTYLTQPGRKDFDTSRICTYATLDWAPELSRRLEQSSLLDPELNMCDYSYFTGLGVGAARTQTTIHESWRAMAVYCSRFDKDASADFPLSVVVDKCYRGVGQGLAMRTGSDSGEILSSCRKSPLDHLIVSCTDGAYSFLVFTDDERDAHRLGGYWMDPETGCAEAKEDQQIAACARYSLQEYFRRAGNPGAEQLIKMCKKLGSTQACGVGLGEIQALYLDRSGKDIVGAMDLCAKTGDRDGCLSRWLSTLVIRHDEVFARRTCDIIVKTYGDSNLSLCARLEGFLESISTKSRFGRAPDWDKASQEKSTSSGG